MSEPEQIASARWDGALDSLASGLFAVFVLFLFLGYLRVYPTVPYSGLAVLPLLGSLLTMVWANWSADRRVSTSPPPNAH